MSACTVFGGGGGGGSCLPGDALLTARLDKESAPQIIPASEVPLGAMLLTSRGFSRVYLHGHFDPDASSTMVRIETASGYVLELSPLHYLEVGGVGFTAAQHVTPKMRVAVSLADGTWSDDEVAAVSRVLKRGLFAPFTMVGDVVVATSANSSAGVLVSDQSEWFAEGYVPEALIPHLYHALLAPVRLLYALAPDWVSRFHTSALAATHAAGGVSLDGLGPAAIFRTAIATAPPVPLAPTLLTLAALVCGRKAALALKA